MPGTRVSQRQPLQVSHVLMTAPFLSAQSEIEASVSARNIRRLLSFQRYLRSSRFFRGTTVSSSLNILDDDYNGQAKVCTTSWKRLELPDKLLEPPPKSTDLDTFFLSELSQSFRFGTVCL